MTVEGLDFSGKSTLVEHLKGRFAHADPPVRFFREPGGTPLAERVRGLVLLERALEVEPWAEAYLYSAARADLVRREILPRLELGETVVCDRFLDSSLAYQGAGRGLGVGAVRELNAPAVGGLAPDVTFYLRLPLEERARRAGAAGALDRIESADDEFVRRVEGGFEEIARGEPERVRALDATLPPEELAEEAGREIEALRRILPAQR